MRRRRVIGRALAGAVVACLALSGCTGIPDSSSPRTVGSVRLDPGDDAASALPQKDASPPLIVSDFLDANAGATDSSRRASTRAYLTPTARNQWSDQRVTIVRDLQIKTFDATKGTLEVTGRVIGTINVEGIYQPTLQGTGDGGRPTPFPFTLRKVGGQYRIDQLRSGLLITLDQFRQTYTQHLIYYYDVSDKYLVPDVRWTAIPTTDTRALATWLVDQLVSAPRPELQELVSTDTFPANVDPDRITVRESEGALRIEIPGSLQLEATVRNLLAKQLARTLTDVASGSPITVTDGGSPVLIPTLQSTSFTSSTFPAPTPPSVASSEVYYLNQGHILDQNGHLITGAVNGDSYYLNSIAVTRKTSAGPLSVAAVVNNGNAARLYIGNQTAGLTSTSVHGSLTRPTWAPGRPEVWVGVGATIHLVTVDGHAYKDSTVQLPLTAGGGRIRSLRISPDGSQLALVVEGSGDATGQLYVGAIVRESGSVHVSNLQSISPADAVVTDADWITSQKLTAVGYVGSPDDGSVFEVGVDGSSWTSKGMAGLSGTPQSITASNYGTWVGTEAAVYTENGSGWRSPSPTGYTAGSNPVYLS